VGLRLLVCVCTMAKWARVFRVPQGLGLRARSLPRAHMLSRALDTLERMSRRLDALEHMLRPSHTFTHLLTLRTPCNTFGDSSSSCSGKLSAVSQDLPALSCSGKVLGSCRFSPMFTTFSKFARLVSRRRRARRKNLLTFLTRNWVRRRHFSSGL